MKKGVILFFVALLFIYPVFAQSSSSSSSNVNSSKISLAYSCLEDSIDEKGCDKLSLKEQIYSLWAGGHCKSEVLDEAINDECWPSVKDSNTCDIKTTAQAILALNGNSRAESWLQSKNSTPNELNWMLQIDGNKELVCTISYSGSDNTLTVLENKQLQSGAGSCLSKDSTGYWLRVNPSCYDETFEISCDEDFITSLLYTKQGSDTIYVSDSTHSQSALGTTEEKIDSLCFSSSTGSCDYEGSLWAATALDYLDNDVSPFTPYLISLAPENDEFLPESFLYYITGEDEYKNDLLVKQISNKYWDYSGNKFYDTAIALFPLRYDSSLAKTNAINWLLSIQGNDGCWDNGNIQNTALILATVWPERNEDDGGTSRVDCEDSGYYCTTSLRCADSDGEFLTDYSCSGVFKCCSVEPQIKTCDDQLGDVCNSRESCVGGTIVEASDLNTGESCCVSGSCQIPNTNENECEDNDGVCRANGCEDSEDESSLSCKYSSDSCCLPSSNPPSDGISIWIWILLILIILIIIGIIYRNRLRVYFLRFKGGSSPSNNYGPRTPPSSSIPQRFGPRPIIQNQRNQQSRIPPQRKPSNNLDEALRKLKEMGG